MCWENIKKLASDPKYLLLWVAVAVVVGGLYIGPLTNQDNYNTFGWLFAVLFPVLVGFVIAMQVYNAKERKSCPATASAGGVLGGLVGLVTVACPLCPLVLLGWLGLAAGATGGLLGGPWVKLASLVVLGLSAYWAAK